MSDQPGMSHDELIAALRSDMKATSADRDEQRAERLAVEADITKLKAEATAAADPDAQIRAGIAAIKKKFAALFRK
jgi:hypothetical protein